MCHSTLLPQAAAALASLGHKKCMRTRPSQATYSCGQALEDTQAERHAHMCAGAVLPGRRA